MTAQTEIPEAKTAELGKARLRKEDLSLLLQSFLAEFNERNHKSVSAVDPAAMSTHNAEQWGLAAPLFAH